jgi:hypothetical protein
MEKTLLSTERLFAKSLSDWNFTGLRPSSVSMGPSMPLPSIALMKSFGELKMGAPIVMPLAIVIPITNSCICMGSVHISAVGAPAHTRP